MAVHLYQLFPSAQDPTVSHLKYMTLLKPLAERRFDEYPHQLSGGMRQRVMIAMALSCNASLFIADEPTTALDVTIQAQILELMRELKEKENKSLMLITHDMEEVVDADRVIVMDDGHIVMDGTPKEIFSRVEELKQYRMDVPQVTELAWELKKKGIPLPDGILRKSELLDALVPLLKEE